MNINDIENAAKKAEDVMAAKYGNSWCIIYSDEDGEEQIEIKPEYLSEYDDYYSKFLGAWS